MASVRGCSSIPNVNSVIPSTRVEDVGIVIMEFNGENSVGMSGVFLHLLQTTNWLACHIIIYSDL